MTLKKFDLSKHFFVQEEGFRVRTALSFLTQNALCQLPSVEWLTCTQPSHGRKNWIYREARKKPLRIPPIRNAHIISLRLCLILERAFVQVDYTKADDKWARSNAD